MLSTFDFVKEVPSMKSFACVVNEDSNKELEKQIKGKWKLEQAIHKDKVFIP
jgi:hypothetical protein